MNELSGEKVDTLLSALDTVDHKFVVFAKRLRLEEGRFTSVDLLVWAVIIRGMSLCDGFVTLARAENFIAAGHLVRPHLDNYLRLSALWLVANQVASLTGF